MRTLILLLTVVLVLTDVGVASPANPARNAQQGEPTETARILKIKDEVRSRGADEKSRVRITLGNGTMIKRFISKIDESTFDVSRTATGQATSISYSDVQKIQGPGLSTGAKIGIGVAIGAAIAIVVIVIEFAKTGYLR